MNADQRALAATIAGARNGVVGGPFAIWLRTPDIAQRIEQLSDRLRKHSRIEKRLVELIVLVVTRDWNADYAWTAHAKQAVTEGISGEAVEAIRAGTQPELSRDDERLVYDMFAELSRTRTLSDATYERALAAFGLELLIEMVTTAGLYTMISMTLAVFDVPTTDGAPA